MKALRIVFRLGLLIGLGIGIPGSPTIAQTTPPKEAQPQSQGLRKLTGDDAKRAEELDKSIDAAQKADRWDEAIAKAAELLALRTRAQGPNHFETVDAEWRLKTLRRLAPMPKEDRVAYQSAKTMNEQAATLYFQGKYALAQPLFEKALEIRRRLLTDDHPDTAESYNDGAVNLNARGSTLRPSPSMRRRWRSAAACSPTTIPTPPSATTTWRSTSTRRESTPRPSGCTRRRWRSAGACSPTTTPRPPPATTAWRTT